MIKDLLAVATGTVFAVANFNLTNPQSQERAEIYDQSIKASASFYCQQMNKGKAEEEVLDDVFYFFIEKASTELEVTQTQFFSGLNEEEVNAFWDGFNFYGRKQCPKYWEQNNNDHSEI